MQFLTAALLALSSSALVAAQIPDPSSLPPCVLNCTQTSAASTDCGTIANVTCLCSNPAFATAAGTCLQSCSAADQKTATTFQTQVCAAFGAGSGTAIPAPGPTDSAPAPGASTPASNPSTPAASASTPAASPTQTDTGAARALSANAAAAVIAAAALAFAL